MPRIRDGELANRGTKAPPTLSQSAFIELDEVKISPDVFAAFAAGLLQKMEETRLLHRGIGMAGNHGLVPLFDLFQRMPCTVLSNPVENGRVIVEFVSRFLEGVGIDFQKRQKMFVETDCLVIVAGEQTPAMEPSFVDQTR